jgi:type III secretion system FlhB-like substrate exporter
MAEPETAGTEISRQAAEVAASVSEADQPQERRRLISAFTGAVTSGARAAGRGTRAVRRRAGSGTGWLADQVVAMAPRLRIRDQAALRAQFPGQGPGEIADTLIERASRAAAAAGGAAGVAATLPVLPAFPAEIAAETLVLVGIEVKLVAELHEAYGSPAPGKFPERMSAYLAAWAHRRGVFMIEGGLIFAAGSPLARLLRRRLAIRAGRSAISLGPMLTGAAAGALFNRRETRRLGRDIQRDLCRREIAAPARQDWWDR